MKRNKNVVAKARKMNVTLVYPFVHNRGGVERYVLALGRFLRQYYDVEIAACEWDERYDAEFRFLKTPAARFLKFLVPLTFALSESIVVRRSLFRLVHVQGANAFRQDIVTAHSCHRAWFIQSTRSLRFFSVSWLLKVLNPIHYVTMFIESVQYRQGNFRKIIAISSLVKRELVQYYGIRENAIQVIYHGVDYEGLSPKKNARVRVQTRKEFGIREKEIAVLFVGNEFRRKGLGPLIQALARLADPLFKLIVVGGDDPAPYLAMASALGVQQQVIVAGSTEHVDRFFAASDCFVLPTVYEPFGMVITEAMASALPVVVSAQAGAAELIKDRVEGILIRDAKDPGEIAAHLKTLADVRKRSVMGKAGREKMRQYTWERTAEHTRHVYEQLLRSS